MRLKIPTIIYSSPTVSNFIRSISQMCSELLSKQMLATFGVLSNQIFKIYILSVAWILNTGVFIKPSYIIQKYQIHNTKLSNFLI